MPIPSPRAARSRLGAVSRDNSQHSEIVAEARRDLAAAVIAAEIGRRLAGTHPLTNDQVTEIVGLLLGGKQ